ncbi:MAG: hypothetical protein ABL962_04590 [Fimbriimonadaceae bacterium]
MSKDCNRFRFLIEEQRDRTLTFSEIALLNSHREVCAACCQIEQAGAMALNMLSPYRVDDVQPAKHERRILRAARAQYLRSGLKFWSPALAGVALGVLVMAAAFQLVGRPNPLQRSQNQGADAMRVMPAERSFPELNTVKRNK